MLAPFFLLALGSLAPSSPGLEPTPCPPLAGNLLTNPGFERGGDELEPWVHSTPLSAATSKPRFTVTEHDPSKGKRSASLRVDYYGGFTCYAQTLRVPPRAKSCLLYTSPSPRDQRGSRMPSSA